MGLTLPGELERILNDLGFTWPEVDEQDLFTIGGRWCEFAGAVSQSHQTTTSAAASLFAGNGGDALEAFAAKFSGQDAPATVIGDASTGVQVVGVAMYAAAGIVLGLKAYTITNLVILACEIAEAIATAVPTFGASLAEIPVFEQVTQRIIGAIVNEAVMAIMS